MRRVRDKTAVGVAIVVLNGRHDANVLECRTRTRERGGKKKEAGKARIFSETKAVAACIQFAASND